MAVGIDEGQAKNYNKSFPVAGKDQSSAPFRDNFEVIQNAVENIQSKTITASGAIIGVSSIFDSGTPTIPFVTIFGDNPVFPGTASLTTPIGTTGQRPGAAINGMLRYNSDDNVFEGYENGQWVALATTGGSGGLFVNVTGDTMSGNLVMSGAVILNADGDANDPSYAFTLDSDTGMYSAALGEIGFTANGTERVNIASATTTIRNNFLIEGASTLIDSATVNITATYLIVNKDEAGAGVGGGTGQAGLTVERGSEANVNWEFDDNTDSWRPTNSTALSNLATIIPTSTSLTISTTGAIIVPSGTTAQRLGITPGEVRYNSDDDAFDFYTAAGFVQLAIAAGASTFVRTAGDTMTGDLTLTAADIILDATQLVDGRDISADGIVLDAIDGGDGFVTRGPAPGTFNHRTITGTANEIAITDGDGLANDPIIGLTSDIIVSGTGSITVPSGTVGQRPGSPTAGMIRHNSDANVYEAYTVGIGWDQVIRSTEISLANTGTGDADVFKDRTGNTFNLRGLTGGTNVTITENTDDVDVSVTGLQASNSELDGLATLATLGLVTRTAGGTYVTRQITAGSGLAITNGLGTSDDPRINLDISSLGIILGANVQSVDSMLMYDDTTAGHLRITFDELAIALDVGSFNGGILTADLTMDSNADIIFNTGSELVDGGSGGIVIDGRNHTTDMDLLDAATGTGNAFVVKTAASTYRAATLLGTTDEIVIADGDGSIDPIFGIADDPIIPGTGRLKLPTGTTAERPGAPAAGDARFNTTDNRFEIYTGSDWERFFRLNGDTMVGSITIPTGEAIIMASSTTVDGRDVSVDGILLDTIHGSTDGFKVRTGSSTYESRTFQIYVNEIKIDNPDGVAGDPKIGLAPDAILPGVERMLIPKGTTAQRPSIPTVGDFRYNSQTSKFEGYGHVGPVWGEFAISTDLDNYLLITNNLSDLSNTAAARTNLSVFSQTDSDDRFVRRDATTLPTVDATYDLGSASFQWNNIHAVTFHGTVADIAERYHADDYYNPGTVLRIGGKNEVTVSSIANDTRVIGIVSTEAAIILNEHKEDGTLYYEEENPAIALKGKVPCRVYGKVKRGDLLTTSDKEGCAQKATNVVSGSIIGKALTENAEGFGVIDVFVVHF